MATNLVSGLWEAAVSLAAGLAQPNLCNKSSLGLRKISKLFKNQSMGWTFLATSLIVFLAAAVDQQPA